jgi:hypothetical protein
VETLVDQRSQCSSSEISWQSEEIVSVWRTVTENGGERPLAGTSQTTIPDILTFFEALTIRVCQELERLSRRKMERKRRPFAM